MNVHELAEALVAQEPVEPVLDTCAAHLETAGFDLERREDPSLLIARRGTGGPWFSGHVDVVPAGAGWTSAPFGGHWSDGRLVARGASDMRGPVACMLAAVAGSDAHARVVLTTDEEDKMHQVRGLVEEGLVEEAPLVVVGEPTGLDVATCGKGVAWLQVTATGALGHGSQLRGPGGRGLSAAERLCRALADLPASPLAIDHPVLGPSSASLTRLSTPEGPPNVLAEEATAVVDGRFPSPGTPEQMRDAVADHLGVEDGLEVVLFKGEPAFQTEPEVGGRVVQMLEAAGLKRATIGVPFASEAGHWAKLAPTVICGPGFIGRAHKPDEFITRQELTDGVAAYRAILAGFAPGT